MASIIDAVTGSSSAQTSGAQGYTKGFADRSYSDVLSLLGEGEGGLNPFMVAGGSVLPQLTSEETAGFNPADFQGDPGYKFALEQGTLATQNAAGVKGSPFGGAAMAAIDQYTQGLANQQYQNAFNRWETGVQNLQQTAGIGETAAGQQSDLVSRIGAVLAQIMGAGTGNVTSAANTQTSANASMFGNSLGDLAKAGAVMAMV